MFGQIILKPDRQRTPAYDNAHPKKGRLYEYTCTCGTTLSIDLPSYIGNYSDQESVLGANWSEPIREHFGLRQDRSLADGWPKFRVEQCSTCGTRFLVYVAVFEPANGWFKIVPQGITELKTSNKGLQSTSH